MILNASASTEDDMSLRPDADGSYGPLDTILRKIADQALGESADLRRPPAGKRVG